MPAATPRTEWVERLDAAPAALVWAAMAVAAALLHVIDAAWPGIGLGPFYMPVIALAAWRFGAPAGLLVTAAAIALNATAMIRDGDGGTAGIALARGLVRIGGYLFTLAIVWAARRVYERERALARVDSLTGVANRRVFLTALDAAMRSARSDTILLALVDLDGFKAVNDHHGHAAGDAVLRGFAADAAAAIRAGDALGRIGGDEFALFLRVPDPAEAHRLATVLHARLSDRCAAMACPVGVSMGALVIPPDAAADTSDGLVRADRLLYEAKRSGKRGVRVGELPRTPALRPVERRTVASRGCGATFSAMPFGIGALAVVRPRSAPGDRPGVERADRRAAADAPRRPA